MHEITVTHVENKVTVVAQSNTVELTTSGPQGPAGAQNLFVGPDAPNDPEINWVWIQTES